MYSENHEPAREGQVTSRFQQPELKPPLFLRRSSVKWNIADTSRRGPRSFLVQFVPNSLLLLRLLSLGKDIDTSLAVRANRRLSVVALLEPFCAHSGRSDVAVKDLGRQ